MSVPPAATSTASLLGNADTIVAQATPAGRGALAVIRVSGPRANAICAAVADPWPSQSRVVSLSALRDGTGSIIDQALITRFDAPASFTGEDVVEISAHGGIVVPATIVATLVERGARLALPGEFTRRALLNGKVDLLQAEAIGDLVAATSRAAQRVALDQLDGGLSRRVMDVRQQLIGLEALLAYDIDFPEEDDGPIPRARILATIDRAVAALESLTATARTGELVRDGALVVLGGPPNAGKSSLFNALVGQRRAIVTEVPGTTRDAIEAVIDAGRWPLRLVDTAGLREGSDRVEELGIMVARDYIERAAIVLVCGETMEQLDATSGALATVSPAAMILVATKADLRPIASSDLLRVRNSVGAAGAIAVSAETGAGLADLTEMIWAQLDAQVGTPTFDAPILTRARHHHVVSRAHQDLAVFRQTLIENTVPVAVATVYLRGAVTALEDLIGAVDVEQILDEVFSRFCVGK